MDKPDKDTYDRYCPMCEYLQAEWQCKAAEIEGTGTRKTFMARQATMNEVRQLVAEEAAKIMSLTCDSKEQGSISRLYAAIVTAIDDMKSANV